MTARNLSGKPNQTNVKPNDITKDWCVKDLQEPAEWDSMSTPLVGLALMPSQSFLVAALPLFQNEEVDILEWSPDIVLDKSAVPDWLDGLLVEFGNQNRLLGHGVYYSLFDANWGSRQEQWLSQLKEDLKRHNYCQLTEHFGLMSSTNAHAGFPMPINLNEETLALGINRLQQLKATSQKPIGLENLAFAFTAADVKEQGVFLEKLLAPVDGFLILDLHNLYCQSHNFKISIPDLLAQYPLQLVREIHVSGGSWSEFNNEPIRRDTHDDRIPEEVFEAVEYALPLCPHLEFVIFEQLSIALGQAEQQEGFRDDFLRLRNIVVNRKSTHHPKKWSSDYILENSPLTNEQLLKDQRQMQSVFMNPVDLETAKTGLNGISWAEGWSDAMIHTALLLGKKWN